MVGGHIFVMVVERGGKRVAFVTELFSWLQIIGACSARSRSGAAEALSHRLPLTLCAKDRHAH